MVGFWKYAHIHGNFKGPISLLYERKQTMFATTDSDRSRISIRVGQM